MNILCIDVGLPFSIDTPYNKPLGGSECSLLLLGMGISEISCDNKVIILNNNEHSTHSKNKRLYLDNIRNIDQYIKNIADIVILNRVVTDEIFNIDKDIYYYAHDAYDQKHVQWMSDTNKINKIKKIICVSEWQKETFKLYFNVSEDKLFVLGNSIITSLYNGYAERDKNKLIFSCIPYKGLNVIGDLFNDICIKSKNDNLYLNIFSSMELYNQNNNEYINIFNKLSKIKNININNLVSMKDLAYEYCSSSIFIHPQTYHESFGINYVSSQCGGCLPVTTNKGSAKEVIYDNKLITKGSNIENINCWNEFVNIVCELLDSNLYNDRLKAMDFSSKWDYLKIANKFLKLIEE